MCVPLPEQGPKLAEPVSIEHSKLAPGSELKVNVGVASLVSPDGPESMLTTGALVSTVQVELAGVWSTLPAWSIARTSNVWLPSARRSSSSARCRLAQSAASVESIRHWNEATPEPPVSVPEKTKLAAALFVSAGGLAVDLGLGDGGILDVGERRRARRGVAGRDRSTWRRKVVRVSSATETRMPAASSAAVAVAIGEPEQSS